MSGILGRELRRWPWTIDPELLALGESERRRRVDEFRRMVADSPTPNAIDWDELGTAFERAIERHRLRQGRPRLVAALRRAGLW